MIQRRLAEQYPDTDRDVGVYVEQLKETTVGSVRGSLWLLFGAVSVLLLIASTNIAALLLARAAKRSQEISVRLSLGAPPATIRSASSSRPPCWPSPARCSVCSSPSRVPRRCAGSRRIFRASRSCRSTAGSCSTRWPRSSPSPSPAAWCRRSARRESASAAAQRRAAHAGVVAPLAAMVVRRHPGCLVGRAACRRGVADPQLPGAVARRSGLRERAGS